VKTFDSDSPSCWDIDRLGKRDHFIKREGKEHKNEEELFGSHAP